MIAALTNHLWQSTLFVLAAWLVAAALRKNGAHIRHRVWVVASLKFLVPFSILMSLGGWLPTLTPALTTISVPIDGTPTDLSVAVDRIAQPFTSDVFDSSTSPMMTPAATGWMTIVVAGTWASGFAAVAFMRLRGWRRVRAAIRESTPLHILSAVPVRSSPGLLEPGVVGLWRPVLLLPAGIERYLSPRQLEAVLAHELCHVQRRDNLTSAIHMVVEAAFWFHPLVWFVGARLVDERERACDEHVLRVCSEPQAYAESILNVCKLYVESPLACVAGVSGSDLKKRIATIVGNRVGLELTFARKVALALAAALTVTLPLMAGLVIASAAAPASAKDLPTAGRQAGAASAFAKAPADKTAGQVASKFDAVSIKPCTPPPPTGRSIGGGKTSPGYLFFPCATLEELIESAYAGPNNPLLNTRVNPQPEEPKRVRGGPSWVYSEKFSLEARGAGGQDRATLMGPMLRVVLEDRFQLQVRRATEQRAMYALTLAKGGLDTDKVKPTAPNECWVRKPGTPPFAPPGSEALPECGAPARGDGEGKPGNIRYTYVGMALDGFPGVMDRPVMNRTGLDGRYNFVLEFAPDDSTPRTLNPRSPYYDREKAEQQANPGPGPTIFKALEALGLKLEPANGPAEYIAIDRVERPRPDGPAENAVPPTRAQGAGGGR